MTKYEVQTKFTYGFENVWHDEDGKLEYFDSYQEAEKEIKELGLSIGTGCREDNSFQLAAN